MKNQIRPACRAHARLRGAAVAACLALVSAFLSTGAACPKSHGHGPKPLFSAVYVFGDSYSDTWRFASVFDPPYTGMVAALTDGRVGNGPLWVEYLAPALGLPYDLLDNYAFNGATTGNVVYAEAIAGAVGLPGMLEQVDEFLATLDPAEGADPDALYVVMGGGNDMTQISWGGITPPQAIAQVVQNTLAMVATLKSAGAQTIVVVDIHDLGVTPLIRSVDAINPGAAALFTNLCATTNQQVAQALAVNHPDVILVSRFDIYTDILAHPSRFGISNTTEPSFPDLDLARHSMFWDSLHVTTRVQALLALRILEALNEADLSKGGHRFGHWERPPFACGVPHR